MTTFKIVELFDSIQGEGYFTGTPMTFARLAQCPVGGPRGICKTADGKPFVCDTGASYKSRSKTEFHPYTEVNLNLTAQDIIERVRKSAPVPRICITGGEPFIYTIEEIAKLALDRGIAVHIETSGTHEPERDVFHLFYQTWVTWSPKAGYKYSFLSLAKEIKLLIDHTTTPEFVSGWSADALRRNIYFSIQPIDDANKEVRRRNYELALKLCLEHGYRLSMQTHKILEVR